MKTNAGKYITLDRMKLRDIVADVKAKIHSKEGILPSQYHILFAGKQLKNLHKPLRYYGIHRRSTLYLGHNQHGGMQVFLKTLISRARILLAWNHEMDLRSRLDLRKPGSSLALAARWNRNAMGCPLQ